MPPDGSGLSTDHLSVRYSGDTGIDAYVISDDGYWSLGQQLTLIARVRGFLDDADIVQSFALTAADADDESFTHAAGHYPRIRSLSLGRLPP